VKRARRLPLAIASALATALPVSAARGEGAHAAIVCVEGTDGDAIASRVASLGGDRVGANDAVCRSLGPAALAAAARDPRADARVVGKARAAARAAHAEAVVLVYASRGKRGAGVHVWLVDAKGTGAARVDRQLPLRADASAADEAEAAWSAVAGDLPSPESAPSPLAAPDAPPTSEPAPQPAPADTATPERAPEADAIAAAPREAAWAHAIVFVRASMEVGSRDFSYVDRLSPSLQSYSLFAAPLARVDGELYPLARTGIPVAEGLGVTADYAMAFGLSSSNGSGGSVDTSWSRLDVGARERIALGRRAIVGLHGGYGQIFYTFGASPDASARLAGLPGVRYRFVSGGADARVTFGATSVYASGSYLGVLGAGSVGDSFPRATIGGVEGRAGVTQGFGPGLQLSLELAYTRFYYTLDPEPGDAYVAGGALDQMATASLGVGYLF
jgi:hypothetical protein